MPGLVDDLKQQMEDDRVVVFVGAGVSLTATGGDLVAGWQGLLRNGIEYCVDRQLIKDPGSIKSARQLVESGDTDLMIAGAGLIKNWLKLANLVDERTREALAMRVGRTAPPMT